MPSLAYGLSGDGFLRCSRSDLLPALFTVDGMSVDSIDIMRVQCDIRSQKFNVKRVERHTTTLSERPLWCQIRRTGLGNPMLSLSKSSSWIQSDFRKDPPVCPRHWREEYEEEVALQIGLHGP
jgi:hypothetical protein